MNRRDDGSRLVYSTDVGRVCPGCGRPSGACSCAKRKQAAPAAGDGVVRVRRETKGRGGKTVTAVAGVPLSGDALKALAADLKKRCGTGGTVKDGTIEIQGDHCDTVAAELAARGFRVKRAGG